jgi:hypothetical protein
VKGDLNGGAIDPLRLDRKATSAMITRDGLAGIAGNVRKGL